ncbi:sugar transport protein 4 [Stagonosporopsis vannaccii]|nr:sugar transport protein 4 [Stagonosporopsis vannaccii]
MASQKASGVWFFIGHQTHFCSIAGITKAFEYSIMNAFIGRVGVHLGIHAMKRWAGRRSLIIFGALICRLCELACGIAASINLSSIATGNVLVAFKALFMFSYDACVGVAAFPLADDIVSSRLRAWTVESRNALGYFLAWRVAFCSPYLPIDPQDLNPDRSLEKLGEIFEAKVSAYKFPDYKYQMVEIARRDVYPKREISVPKQEIEA